MNALRTILNHRVTRLLLPGVEQAIPGVRVRPRLPKHIELAGRQIPVVFRRTRAARRYILKLDHAGRIRVTIPPSGTNREALIFIDEHRGWLTEQVETAAVQMEARIWRPSTEVMFKGEFHTFETREASRGTRIRFAHWNVLTDEVPDDLADLFVRRFKRLARKELPPRVTALALDHGYEVKKLTIRSQRTLWGSCSSNGTLSLNWKLIQLPEWIRDYVICHELAHLKHLDHSPEFWALCEKMFPRSREAEKWLKKNEHRLVRQPLAQSRENGS